MEINEYSLEPNPREVTCITSEDDIFLSIQIGNGQIGGNRVKSNGITLAKGNLTQPTSIGKATFLKTNGVEIDTNVLDVNSFTNMCVITTTFLNQDNAILFTKIDKGDAPEAGIASFKGKYIFKVLIILLIALAGLNPKSFAQKTTDEVEFKNLETPSSPGFILLDKAPTSIEKPTTPQGFGLGLLGFFQGTGGAMEFAPFWLTTHPKLSAKKMYTNKIPALYNLSVSVASTKIDAVNYLAGGLRTRLFQRYNVTQIKDLGTKEQEITDALSEDTLDLVKIEQLRQEYVGLIEKPVFVIDFAAALGGGSTSNSFNNLKLNRWAGWLSFHWQPKGEDFYFSALTRYINNERFEEYLVEADLIDLGIRFNYDIAKLTISLEYLQRLNLTQEDYDDNRIALAGNYRISDKLFITSTFGKNFSEVDNIIALAGINIGFSKSKVKAF
jgi:hypothetical protein